MQAEFSVHSVWITHQDHVFVPLSCAVSWTVSERVSLIGSTVGMRNPAVILICCFMLHCDIPESNLKVKGSDIRHR